MDNALFLLLPLVGGYFFVKNCVLTVELVVRESRHRLYFRAALAAIALLFLASILVWALTYTPVYGIVETFAAVLTDRGIGLDDEFYGKRVFIVSSVALLMGIFGWLPLNYILPTNYFLDRAVRDNDVEKLLVKAAREGRPISVTMENRKVYVGFVTSSLDQSRVRRAISLLPLRSGYRNNNDGTLHFTTNYLRLFEKSLENTKRLQHLDRDDFEIILPADRIQSLSLFDLIAYEEFRQDTVLQDT